MATNYSKQATAAVRAARMLVSWGRVPNTADAIVRTAIEIMELRRCERFTAGQRPEAESAVLRELEIFR